MKLCKAGPALNGAEVFTESHSPQAQGHCPAGVGRRGVEALLLQPFSAARGALQGSQLTGDPQPVPDPGVGVERGQGRRSRQRCRAQRWRPAAGR